MAKPYTAKTLAPGDDLSDAFLVRSTVFVEEQGFDPALETDRIDLEAHHVVLYDGDRPIATGRVFSAEDEPGLYAIGRVAVLAEYRGGTGSLLMSCLESLALERGARFVTLGAQCRVQGFYSALGYRPLGEVYYDEFCPHIHMKKIL